MDFNLIAFYKYINEENTSQVSGLAPSATTGTMKRTSSGQRFKKSKKVPKPIKISEEEPEEEDVFLELIFRFRKEI